MHDRESSWRIEEALHEAIAARVLENSHSIGRSGPTSEPRPEALVEPSGCAAAALSGIRTGAAAREVRWVRAWAPSLVAIVEGDAGRVDFVSQQPREAVRARPAATAWLASPRLHDIAEPTSVAVWGRSSSFAPGEHAAATAPAGSSANRGIEQLRDPASEPAPRPVDKITTCRLLRAPPRRSPSSVGSRPARPPLSARTSTARSSSSRESWATSCRAAACRRAGRARSRFGSSATRASRPPATRYAAAR